MSKRVLGRLCGAVLLSAGLVAGCGGGGGSSNNNGGGGQQTTPVSFSTTSLPAGTTGTAYSASVQAANGTAPYTFTLASGSLPAGLTLASSGVISGTPTAAGSPAFTVKVTDSSNPQGSATSGSLTIAISAGVSLTTTTLPAGTVGTAYTAAVQATGGTAPYTFTVTAGSGSLPAGLSMDASGNITGTPTAAGTSQFGVTVKDSSSTALTATATLSITINATTLALTGSTLPTAVQNTAYSQSVSADASGGTSPYTFTTSGTLPAGLTLASNGTIAGTPTGTGSSTFTVKVTDSASTPQTATASFTVVVVAPLSITTSSLPAAQVGTAYSQSLSGSGGTTPYTFTVSSGTLPAGLTLASNGTLSGTPTVGGTASLTFKATDATSPQLSATVTLTMTVYTATVQVDTTKTLATVPQTGFGIHTSVYDNSLNNSAVPALLQTGGITMMRYPGGTYSDNYHWAQYAMTPFFASSSPPGCSLSNGYLAPNTDFGNFVKVLQSAGAGAIITVNYGTSVADKNGTRVAGTYGASLNGVSWNDCEEPNTSGQPQEAAAWVAYANGDPSSTQVIGLDATDFDWKTVGFWAGLRAATPLATDDGYNFLRIGQTAPIGVKYWEIGNEIFYNGYVNNINTETDDHAPYTYTGSTYSSRANNTMLSPSAYGTNAVAYINAMKAVDPTIKIGFDLNSDNVTGNPIPTSWNTAAMQSVCAGATFDFGIIHYYPGTYNATTAAQMLSGPQTDYPALTKELEGELTQYCPTNASAVQFFVTETGPNGTTTLSSSQMAVEGLFAADDYLSALESGVQNIDWLELHNNYLDTNTEAPDPPYYGIEMAHLLANVSDSLVSSTSSYGEVVVHASQQAGGSTGILLINADPTNAAYVQVTVSGATLGATATEYNYGINTTQSGTTLSTSSFAVSGNTFTISVPAYTATELIVP